jgi:hypothetical protein
MSEHITPPVETSAKHSFLPNFYVRLKF